MRLEAEIGDIVEVTLFHYRKGARCVDGRIVDYNPETEIYQIQIIWSYWGEKESLKGSAMLGVRFKTAKGDTMSDLTMYDEFVEFGGIKLHVDPINKGESDQILPIFWEEQPMTWYLSRPFIASALEGCIGEIGFLDVGVGGGTFAILIAKHFPETKILAIDINQSAISRSQENAALNGVEFELRKEFYSIETAPYRSCRVIGIYPPYHIYPPHLEENVPLHARGGSDGQREFISQLMIANRHLAYNGVLFFNQMALGNEKGPRYLRYIPALIDNSSVIWTNIFPRMRTADFLKEVYGDLFPSFRKELADCDPWLYFTSGIVRRDNLGSVKCVEHDFDLKGRSWADRIKAHGELAQISLR